MVFINRVVKRLFSHSHLVGLEPFHWHSRLFLSNLNCWHSSPSQHVQILSPGRSGTRWLADVLLESSKSIIVCHASPKTLAEPGYLFNQGLISEAEALGAYRYSRSSYLKYASLSQKCFVDLDCKNTPLASVIADNYKHCKFVVLFRDPVGFIKSGIARGYFRSKDPQAWGHLEEDAIDFRSKSSDEWQIFKIARFWNSIATLSQRVAIAHPEMVTILDCRRMFLDPSVVNGLMDFLDLDSSLGNCAAFAKKPNATRAPISLSVNQLDLLNSLELLDFCFDGLSSEFMASCGF